MSRRPYENSKTRALRLVGRALQARNLRIKVRDGWVCQRCQRLTTEGEVDHKLPLSQGGTDADTNCQWLCLDCHDIKSAQERGEKPKSPGFSTDGNPVDRAHPWNISGGEG